MQLEMKTRCEKCKRDLRPNDDAYICSYECTFCGVCNADAKSVCPHCSGELIRRPRRSGVASHDSIIESLPSRGPRPWLISLVSLVAWTLIAVTNGTSIYQWKRSVDVPTTWRSEMVLPLVNFLIFAFLTPIILYLVCRLLLEKKNCC